MTPIAATKVVTIWTRFVAFDLKKACLIPHSLLSFTKMKWNRATTHPSNSFPCSPCMAVNEKHFHSTVLQILVAINNWTPDPIPYPFYRISSIKMAIKVPETSCATTPADLNGPRN